MNPNEPNQPPAASQPSQAQPFGKPKADKKPRRFIKKFVIILVSLLVLSGGAWAAWEFLVPRLELKAYEGEGFTVNVPAEYQAMPSNGSVRFAEEGEPGDETISSVSIQSTQYQTMNQNKESVIKLYDEIYEEDSFVNSSNADTQSEIRDYKVSSQPYHGLESRQVSFSVYEDGNKVRTSRVRVVFTDDSVYTVTVNNHKDDSELRWTASRIINSLEISE